MYLCKIGSARTKIASPVGTTWEEQGDKKQEKKVSIQRGSIAMLHSTCTKSISAVC
jgi:hypothetical protein